MKNSIPATVLGYFMSQIASLVALEVQIFDSFHFQGPIEVYRNATGCQPLLPPYGFGQVAKSLKTDSCIMVFKDAECASYSYRLDPGDYSDLTLVKHDDTVNFMEPQSYRQCARGEGDSVLDVDVHGIAMVAGSDEPPFEETLSIYRNLCSCTTLTIKSPYVAEVHALTNFGNCVKVYTGINCTGNSVQLLGGISPKSTNLALANLGQFLIPSASISPCEPRPGCHSFTVSTYRFVLNSNQTYSTLKAKSTAIALAPKTIIRNNGNATIQQSFHVKKTIKEFVKIRRTSSFSKTNYNFSTSNEPLFDVYGFWQANLLEKVKAAITTALSHSLKPEENGNVYISYESREIEIQQKIELPPCSEYEIEAFTNLVQKLPIDYQIFSYVSINSRGTPLSAAEVTAMLPEDLKFVADYDEHTVIVKGYGKVETSFSWQTTVDGNGKPIEGCYH